MRGGVEAKIAALGLKVRNGCTYHGLAVNVAMDLAPFADIDPCGYPGLAVTQLADLGVAHDGRARPARSWRRSSPRTLTVADDHGQARLPPTATPPASSTRATRRPRASPSRSSPAERLREARVDPRARGVVAALRRDQEDPARAQPAHGVRGSVVPEHRRVLQQGHRDVHDHGRHLHAALPVLRRRPRPAAAARRRRAGQPREDDRGAEARATS